MKKETSKLEGTQSTQAELLDVFLSNISSLRSYLTRFSDNYHDVEDLLQEAYLRVHQANNGTKVRMPKAFLYKVAKNLAINHKARASSRLTDSLEDFDGLSVLTNEVSPELHLEKSQQFGAFCQAVSLLPDQCRKVFVAKKIYGMSNIEIAKRLGVSVGTVDKHLAKGLVMCRNYMKSVGYSFSELNMKQNFSKKTGLDP